eukprot:snap_masked-scaffold_14-processed-gene-11.40-mRNA-1 protein AED:1.00 eAED:1.00 QI:0/0/0/0/1/1/4/0/61
MKILNQCNQTNKKGKLHQDCEINISSLFYLDALIYEKKKEAQHVLQKQKLQKKFEKGWDLG